MRARPVVDVVALGTSRDEVLERFRVQLAGGVAPCEGRVGRREVSLVLRGEERSLWSPWLSLETFDWDGGTRIRGTFSPHPSLWGMFLWVYAIQVFAFLGGTMFGLVQLSLGQEPLGLYVAMVATVGQGCACGVDLTGRARGGPQMEAIRGFVHQVLPHAQELPADAPIPRRPTAISSEGVTVTRA